MLADKVKTARVSKSELLYFLVFPIFFFYCEALFKLSTSASFISVGTVFTLLFSVCYGMVGFLLTSIFKSDRVNKGIAIAIMCLTAFVFLVEYFIFRQFKVFYDLNTVIGGAGGVVTGFSADIFRMVFSVGGMLRIVLYALPIVLFAVFVPKCFPARKSNMPTRIASLLIAVIVFVFTVLIMKASPIGSKYKDEYTFQSASESFGLMTGLRLDVRYLIFGGSADEEFEIAEIPETKETEPETGEPEEPEPAPEDQQEEVLPEPEEEKPVVYGDNALDIDFAMLAENAPSEKLRELDNYVSSLTPSKKNEYTGLFKGKNLIFISAEAFSAEVIDEELTPTLYRLATKGINFTDYYQPASAGTTGGEYENLFGLMPSQGGKSFKKEAENDIRFTIGNQLDSLGYYGKAFHNNTYTFYSRDKTHIKLGYSDGYMGYGSGMEEYVTKQWPQSDLEMIAGTLPTYIDKQPFNVYYMSVSGHSGYSRGGNAMTAKNWDRVSELPYSDAVKGYLAANIELDLALEETLRQLDEKGILNDTVICIAADHFPYGLDDDAALGNMPYLSELYGYDVKNMFQRDHNRLIIWCGCLEENDPIVIDEPTFSLDILPTLSNLFGTEFDSRLMPGRDVLSDAEALVFNTGYDWKTSLGTYYSSSGKFVPVSEDAEIPDGYVDTVKAAVKNKLKYCASVLETDYYAHVFGADSQPTDIS